MIEELQRELSRDLDLLQKEDGLEPLLRAITRFELLSGRLYRLRGDGRASAAARERAEDYVADAALRLTGLAQGESTRGTYAAWIARYRELWRVHRALFVTATAVLVATSVIGWTIGARYPEYVPVIVPQAQMEMIVDGEPWFERLNDSPLLGGVQIALNNIRVAMLCFAGSAAFGLGGVALLAYNGLLFGAMFGFCALHGFDRALMTFVLGHGPLELTIIVASVFAGMLFGRAFWQGSWRALPARLGDCGRDAGVVLAGVVPWLVVAATVEAFVSPLPDLALGVKAAVGAALAVAFWSWTLTRAKG